MDSGRWRRVEQLYYEVAAYPPGQRAQALDAACSSDIELRQEVESLLGASDQAGDFLSPDDLPHHVEDLAPPTSAIGNRLGDYEILGVLGAGGMGEVYRARDTRLGRHVALKILPPHLTHDTARVSRFQSEARAASALNHQNSVTIYEIGNAAGTWFIAAELIEGVTLRARMKSGTIPVPEAIAIALQCAATLTEAHRAGIVHRDIKPENIMIRSDGVVKIVDFGLARILEPSLDWARDATQTGSIMGTPRYMSPEQARGQKPDARSDIFSLGAVLFEMVGARPAFPGDTAPEIFASLLSSEPDLALTGTLGEPLARALRKDPAARYQSMEEFAIELRNFDPAKKPARRPFATRKTWAAAALVTAAALGAYGWISRDTTKDTPLKVVPLATFAGPKAYPAISADGTRVAFSWAPRNGKRHIYVRSVGEGDPRQLTSSQFDDAQAAWSPDGSQIAFTRLSNGDKADVSQEVFLIPSDGGPERKVTETWRGVSFAPGGKQIALTNVPNEATTPATQTGGIVLLALESGEHRTLTKGFRDSFPVYSPDGKWIAFKRQFSGSAAQIFAIPAAGGAATQLTFDPLQPIRASTWTPDSREVVFASLRSGLDGSLWRVPVTGGKARPVSATLRDAADPTISRQGGLAHLEEWVDSNLYLLSAADPQAATFSEPLAVVNSSREDHSPAFSPDGERIAFVSERSGNLEIWTARRDGSQAVQLTTLRAQNTGTPQWSPDARSIAFDSWASGKSDIYITGAAGGVPRVLTKGTMGSWMPSWSPDGQWIYFSRGLSGATDIWKIRTSGGDDVQLTRSGGFEARPSPDGNTVYYSKQTPTAGRAIWSVPSEGGAEKPVAELAPFPRIGRAWGVMNQGIYFVSHENSPQQTVRLLNFRTRKVTSLFTLQKQIQWGIRSLAFSPDGRHALAAQLDHSVSDVMLIENFR